MKPEKSYGWFVRILWPLLGGAWGAWIGFQGYFRVPLNADTFAPLIVLGVFAFCALIGLISGVTLCALIGGLTERLLRYFGIGIVGALVTASLVNVLAIWQLTNFIQQKYPGFQAAEVAKPQHRTAPYTPASANKGTFQKPCAEPPPTDARERRIWDAECS